MKPKMIQLTKILLVWKSFTIINTPVLAHVGDYDDLCSPQIWFICVLLILVSFLDSANISTFTCILFLCIVLQQVKLCSKLSETKLQVKLTYHKTGNCHFTVSTANKWELFHGTWQEINWITRSHSVSVLLPTYYLVKGNNCDRYIVPISSAMFS